MLVIGAVLSHSLGRRTGSIINASLMLIGSLGMVFADGVTIE